MYQGVFVSLTTGVVTVWAVPFGMIALNVMGPHRGLNCNFCGKAGGILSQNRGANKPPTH